MKEGRIVGRTFQMKNKTQAKSHSGKISVFWLDKLREDGHQECSRREIEERAPVKGIKDIK